MSNAILIVACLTVKVMLGTVKKTEVSTDGELAGWP